MEEQKVFNQEEWHLVQQCVRKDPHAWRIFVDRYARWVFHLTHHILKKSKCTYTPEDAEGLLVDVFTFLTLDNFRVLKDYPEGFSLKAWLRGIVCGRCYPFLRRKRPSLIVELAILEPNLPHRFVEQESAPDAAETAFEKLTMQERFLLILFYFIGQRYDEISKSLDIPPEHVGGMVFRAREKLKNMLRPII